MMNKKSKSMKKFPKRLGNTNNSIPKQMSNKLISLVTASNYGSFTNLLHTYAGIFFQLYPPTCGVNGGAPTTLSQWLSKIGNNNTFNDLGLYLGARILRTRAKVVLTNLESFPVTINIVKVPYLNAVNLFNSSNISTIMDSFENRKSVVLDKAGTTNAYKVVTLDIIPNLLEGRDLSKDVQSVGSYTSVPAIWQMLYIQSHSTDGTTNLAAQIDYQVSFAFDVEFQGLKITTN
jgi:hypothetical protein